MSISRWLRTQHPMAHWSKHDRKDCIAIDRVMVAVIMSYCPPNRPAINMSSRVKVDISVLAGEEEATGCGDLLSAEQTGNVLGWWWLQIFVTRRSVGNCLTPRLSFLLDLRTEENPSAALQSSQIHTEPTFIWRNLWSLASSYGTVWSSSSVTEQRCQIYKLILIFVLFICEILFSPWLAMIEASQLSDVNRPIKWVVIGQPPARPPRRPQTNWFRWGLRGAEKSEKTEQIQHQCLSRNTILQPKHSNDRI